MECTTLDYDRLLDDWADDLYKDADNYKKKMDSSEMGSYQYGYYKGKYDAYFMAIAKLTMLETRKSSKYKINK